jgi:hypothetical protein
MQVKKKTNEKFKLFTLIGPVANCSFKSECQNSSSTKRGPQIHALALMQEKIKMIK